MNILDIDLDFFLNGRIQRRNDDIFNRPDGFGIVPWSKDEVLNFLNSKLNVNGIFPGYIFVSHDELFYKLKDLIEKDKLDKPFNLVHVDAHSDLGMGFDWKYLHSTFLDLPVIERHNAKGGDDGINYGNFVSFALGCRWISTLDLVINKNWHDDIPRKLLSKKTFEIAKKKSIQDCLPYGDYKFEIELQKIDENVIEDIVYKQINFFDVCKKIGEPTIPLNIITIEKLSNRYSKMKWDYIFLTHSPGYVPSSADYLLQQIGNFIHLL